MKPSSVRTTERTGLDRHGPNQMLVDSILSSTLDDATLLPPLLTLGGSAEDEDAPEADGGGDLQTRELISNQTVLVM